MKWILILLAFLAAGQVLGQYPASGNKMKLGQQTTGDGLTFRGAGFPGYTPSSMVNAYMYGDTVNNKLYYFENNQWNQIWPTELSVQEFCEYSDGVIVVDSQNQTPWDGLAVVGIIGTGGARKRIVLTVNGQSVSFYCDCQ